MKIVNYLLILFLFYSIVSCENNDNSSEKLSTRHDKENSLNSSIDSSLVYRTHEIDLGRLKFKIDLSESLFRNNIEWGHSDFCYIGDCFSDSVGTEFTNLVYYYSYPEKNYDFKDSHEYKVYVRQDEFYKLFNQEELNYNGRKCFLHEYYYSIDGQYYYGFFSHIIVDEVGIRIEFRYTRKGAYNEVSRIIARKCFDSFQVSKIDKSKPRIGVSL